jgi:hypothetical protein
VAKDGCGCCGDSWRASLVYGCGGPAGLRLSVAWPSLGGTPSPALSAAFIPDATRLQSRWSFALTPYATRGYANWLGTIRRRGVSLSIGHLLPCDVRTLAGPNPCSPGALLLEGAVMDHRVTLYQTYADFKSWTGEKAPGDDATYAIELRRAGLKPHAKIRDRLWSRTLSRLGLPWRSLRYWRRGNRRPSQVCPNAWTQRVLRNSAICTRFD